MSDLNLEGLTDAQLSLFAVRCARRVQHLMTNPRSVAALDFAERHARGEATDAELAAARDAAWVARAAAGAAAGAAVRAAASDSAHAVWDAAWAAGWDAERAEQQKILDEIREICS